MSGRAPRVRTFVGFVGRPGWTALRDGARPHDFVAEPGEWQHGWQHFASSSLEHHFRETVVLAQSSAATRLICVPTRDMGPVVFSAVAQPHRHSRFSLHCSGRLCWRGSVSHCRSLKQSASVVLGWTGAGATGQHAHGQGGCDPGQLRQRQHWLGCAGKQEQR